MQNVSFKNIDEFLDYIPSHELKVVNHLRQIVFECMPDCKEKLSYNVPYFYRNSRICFIWPSSITWGKVKTDGVLFGFCNGNLLNDEINYLEKGKRKQVYTKTFFSIKDVNEDLLKSFIFDAIFIDENIKNRKS